MLYVAHILFWLSLGWLAGVLVGFPLLLWARAVLRQRPYRCAEVTPSLSIVIAAYNEADSIRQRIENVLSCVYPRDRIEILVASDGSSDDTCRQAASGGWPEVRVLELPRGGKGRAINAAALQATGEVLVFTDANTHFLPQTLQRLVQPLADPSVGGVAGNQRYLRGQAASCTADGEMWHWSLDTALKRWQDRAGSVTSATGAVYAVRRSLFQPIPDGLMDDFVVSTGVVQQGYRLVFAQDAVALEPVATGRGVEFSRKRRVILQGLLSVVHRRGLLNPRRYGFYSLQLWTHKVLRRLLWVPAAGLVVTTPWLLNQGLIYRVVAAGLLFYLGLALLGIALRGRGPKLVKVPVFLLSANLAALVATLELMMGRRLQLWTPERHLPTALSSTESIKGAAP